MLYCRCREPLELGKWKNDSDEWRNASRSEVVAITIGVAKGTALIKASTPHRRGDPVRRYAS